MEPWWWVGGFALLAMLDLVALRSLDERPHWAWTLWSAPACLVLYGLGWGLDEVAPSEYAIAAWLAMLVVAATGAVASLAAALRSRGTGRVLTAINACALAALAVRFVVFVGGIRLM